MLKMYGNSFLLGGLYWESAEQQKAEVTEAAKAEVTEKSKELHVSSK